MQKMWPDVQVFKFECQSFFFVDLWLQNKGRICKEKECENRVCVAKYFFKLLGFFIVFVLLCLWF